MSWVTTWGAAMSGGAGGPIVRAYADGFKDQTVGEVIRVNAGSALRLTFSNPYGCVLKSVM